MLKKNKEKVLIYGIVLISLMLFRMFRLFEWLGLDLSPRAWYMIFGSIISFGLFVVIIKLIDKYLPVKFKPVLLLGLWALIIYLGYITINSVYGEIRFKKLRDARYAKVIPVMIDIRDAQLAHQTVTGTFAPNFENLIKFIDTAKYTITQQRDSTVRDVEQSRRFGIDMTKDIVIVDTLGYKSVRDSLFGSDNRYKTMMNVPVGKEGSKFEMKTGVIEQNNFKIGTFEAVAYKKDILFDQPQDIVNKELQVVSVEQINGDAIRVGSLNEVNTNGNWPKNYSTK